MNIQSNLNKALIDHYHCFNTERFFLDKANKEFVSVVTSSISDPSPIRLCKFVAKFIKKFYIKHNLKAPDFIYVGPWAIPSEIL